MREFQMHPLAGINASISAPTDYVVLILQNCTLHGGNLALSDIVQRDCLPSPMIAPSMERQWS
jgi:hypothetical protein